jgi:hypothetical protein
MLEENVLQELEQFYVNNPLRLWIPSLQSEQDFRPISVGEQKMLIELENTASGEMNLNYIVEGPRILNSLIKSTCIDEGIFEQLTIVDRPVILLQLKHHIKDTVVMRVDDVISEINLDAFVTRVRKKKPRDLRKLSKISVDNFMIEMHVPNLPTDEFYNNYFLTLYKGREFVNMEAAAGDAFLAELAKYIKSITFETNTGSAEFDFENVSDNNFNRNLDMLQSLPSGAVTKMTDFINQVKHYQTRLITEKIDVKGESKNVLLDIDISFFTTL